jgi:hypothetical protein
MNADAWLIVLILFILDASLLSILRVAPLDDVDRFYIYAALAVHAGIWVGLATENHALVQYLHWGHSAYVVTAPFFLNTTIGKVLYTCIVALQLLLLLVFGRCILSHIKFNQGDDSHTLYPREIPAAAFVVGQMALLAVLWSPVKHMP